jgi:hypothetical protein
MTILLVSSGLNLLLPELELVMPKLLESKTSRLLVKPRMLLRIPCLKYLMMMTMTTMKMTVTMTMMTMVMMTVTMTMTMTMTMMTMAMSLPEPQALRLLLAELLMQKLLMLPKLV